MASPIVIRIVPQSPVSASDFTKYLTALGGLEITAFDVSFNDPTGSTTTIGTASFVAPKTGPSPTSSQPIPPGAPLIVAKFPTGTTEGIVQQWDVEPRQGAQSAFFQLQSVATAIIQVPSPLRFENLRLVVQWGSGSTAQNLPIAIDYYNVALVAGPTPDLDAWTPSASATNPQSDPWGSLTPSLYLQLPAPPGTSSNVTFTLPSNGVAAPFDDLKDVVTKVLKTDPGGTLPDLGSLTLEQGRNIAYEIVWSQQPPVPAPPERVEDMYTSATNSGVLLSGSTPNQHEGDRLEFEAQLKSYYALADAIADRLTSYVFALSAAVACEENSLQAFEAMVKFPADSSQPGTSLVNEPGVILTGLGSADPPANFGVPAAYFYGLASSIPLQVDEASNIIIGSRAGQCMPHPTLIGGSNARVQAAGIVDIRGGKIFSVNMLSGHYKPGTETIVAARKAFGRLGQEVFHSKFEGFSVF